VLITASMKTSTMCHSSDNKICVNVRFFKNIFIKYELRLDNLYYYYYYYYYYHHHHHHPTTTLLLIIESLNVLFVGGFLSVYENSKVLKGLIISQFLTMLAKRGALSAHRTNGQFSAEDFK
jgi:hypothetical protein